MANKDTKMELGVDLKCSYTKIKKIVCKFPEIREYAFDEKKNVVNITVVCCDPEEFRKKLCCKAGKVITYIKVIEKKPEKEKPPEKKNKEEKPGTGGDSSKSDAGKKAPPAPTIPTVSVSVDSSIGIPFGFRCPQCGYNCDSGPCNHGCGRTQPPPPPTCFVNWCNCGRGCQQTPCGGGDWGRGWPSRPCGNCGPRKQKPLLGGCNCGNMGCRR